MEYVVVAVAIVVGAIVILTLRREQTRRGEPPIAIRRSWARPAVVTGLAILAIKGITFRGILLT
jgi:hypothetical protein